VSVWRGGPCKRAPLLPDDSDGGADGKEGVTKPTEPTLGDPLPEPTKQTLDDPLPVNPAKCAVGPDAASIGMDCDESEFCELEEGTCDPPGHKTPEGSTSYGTCAPKPGMMCPKNYDPVCGCDGKNYNNPCMAGSEGVSVWYGGPCKRDPSSPVTRPGTDDLQTATKPTWSDPPPANPSKCVVGPGAPLDSACDDAQFCQLRAGQCSPDATYYGKCAVRSVMCPMLSAPVCGCDGVTYDSWCEAYGKGMNVRYKGPCEEEGGEDVGPNDGKAAAWGDNHGDVTTIDIPMMMPCPSPPSPRRKFPRAPPPSTSPSQ